MSNARELANLVGGTLTNLTSGTDNVALGNEALEAVTSGSNNVGVGKDAGTAITTGADNTLIGGLAGDALTTGELNVAVGRSALTGDVKGNRTVAIGYATLQSQNNSSSSNTYNTAVGYGAGAGITDGVHNTLIGGEAGLSLASVNYNTAVGTFSLDNCSHGSRSTALGYSTLTAQDYGTTSTDSHNTAVGNEAGLNVTSGVQNTFVGSRAGDSFTDADFNVAYGFEALATDTLGSKSTAIGTFALKSQNFTSATNINNTAVGYNAGVNTTTGVNNTFVGAESGSAVTTGSNHSILGKFSGNDNNLDIRTDTNPHIVLSGGDTRPAMFFDEDQGTFGTWFAANYTNSSYWPISGTADGHNAISQNIASGQIGVTTNTTNAVYINRNNADGDLVQFYSTGTKEGSISVSGTTVSYNGGHLSRWSQLTDNSKDASILKGTVMTNLDKMAVWEHAAVAEGDTIKSASGDERTATADDVADAYTEDNEQLNCMAVSSVEGDPNVAGVFVNWDAVDDGYNDMNIAMTGDMIIRIAKGVTIAKGDLLMSAGDGTAKPQDDDIVRSKTIAKVTSTNVSHTYDDKSFCVPCVLMAC
jgi:hypothetical protein